MAGDSQPGSRPGKKVTTYGTTTRKRPYSSAFPHARHDAAKLGGGNEAVRTSDSRSTRPSKLPLSPKPLPRDQISTRSTATSGRQRPVSEPQGDWDPYDIFDIDCRARPKPRNEMRGTEDLNASQQSTLTAAEAPSKISKRGTKTALHDGVSKQKPRPAHATRLDRATDRMPPRERPGRTSKKTDLNAPEVAGKPKPRLIDALADQAEGESSTSANSSDDDNEPAETEAPAELGASTSSSAPLPIMPTATTAVRPGSGLKLQGVRRTYGAQRSMLRDTSLGEEGTFDDISGPLNQPSLQSPAKMGSLNLSLIEDESDIEAGSKGAVRSIHELRRAGANNRFADEVDDLFERIGTPSGTTSSMRRNALLELATKMCSKGFLRQFHDHGFRKSIFERIGEEQDIVSGFALISALLALLPSSVDHRLSKQLQVGGMSALLKKLLEFDSDICAIASQRSLKLPRNAQAAVSLLQASVLKLSVWDPQPPEISPRSLALRFIDVCCKPTQGTACLGTLETLSDDMFSILEHNLQPGFTETPNSKKRHDCLVAASILEAHSATATEADATPRWTWSFLPAVARMLAAILARPSSQLGPLETTLLKLAMNSTNNNPSAAEALQKCDLFQALAEASCTSFDCVKNGVDKGLLNTDAFNRLLLILGLMINFCEHSSSKELLVAGPALDNLISIYLDTHSLTKEADSVEKSQLNVAVGYLSILLGYLSLSVSTRRRFEVMNKGRGLKCLVGSIQEFKTFFESVDGKTASGNHAVRLERLADALAQASP